MTDRSLFADVTRAVRRWRGAACLALLVVAAPFPAPAQAARAEPSLTADAGPVAVRGLPRDVTVNAARLVARPLEVTLSVRSPEGTLLDVGRGTIAAGEDAATVAMTLPQGLRGRVTVMAIVSDAGGALASASFDVRSISSLWSFLPPVLAIGLALAFRQVIPALLAGVLAGAWIRGGFTWKAPLRVLDHDLVRALADTDHLKIVLFTLILGGMVGLIARSGGAGGLVAGASRFATTRRSGQVAGWFSGLFVFFDDYANTLVVGPALRPLTDRLRISREKLAFVVDATAAPVASVALISTWIGYEVGLIGDAIQGTVLAESDAYSVFIASLPYRFYAWLMLLFVLMVGLFGRDFGAMLSAERRAAAGAVMRPDARPLQDTSSFDDARPALWHQALWLALLPVLVVAGATALSLWLTGRAALGESEWGAAHWMRTLFSVRGLGAVLGEAASYDALMYGAGAGAVTAWIASIVHRRLTPGTAVDAFVEGVRSMTLAMMILTLAWMIGGVCADLDTSGAALQAIGESFPARFLPALTFVLAAAIAFATGTSWTTMAVLVPLAIPLADRLAAASGYAGEDAATLLVAVTGSVLTGAVFGDHCSPISDTTVLSSVATGCDHIDHVRTQLPYALAVGGVSLLVGDFAVGFGMPPWASIAAGTALLAVILVVFGRTSPVPKDEPLL